MNRQPRSMIRALAAAAAVVTGVATASVAGAETAPNGLIAYSSWDQDLNYDIYVVDPADPEAGLVRLTTDGRYNGNPDWSPDATKIVYDGWSTFAGPRIQIMDVDPATADWTVLSEPCAGIECYGDFQPAFSPDGTRIAFVSSRPNADGSENWSYEIYVMDATGEVGLLPDATRLTTDPLPEFGGGINDSQVTWSPDGSRLAFLSTGRGADPDSCDLWLMSSRDLDRDGFGDNLQRLTFDESFNCDAFDDVTLQWSPNSSLIAFTSVRTGYFDIWVVNADDPTDLRNVTQTTDVYEDQPSWSPDGTQIVFRSSVSGAYELYSLPVPPPAGGEAKVAAASASAPAPTQLTFDGMTKRQSDWGAEAGFLPGTNTLGVSRTGRGLVWSKPAGILCGRDCISTYVAGTSVTLFATAAPGYRFAGWGGGGSGTGTTRTVQMNGPQLVTAKFVRTS